MPNSLRNSKAIATVLSLLLISLIGMGCTQTETRSYSISVRNICSQPITVGLVKHGGRFEDGWASPEEVAIATPSGRIPDWGVIIPPRITGSLPNIVGTFYPASVAYLRIYLGKYTNSGMLAVSSGAPNRLDIPLVPGENNFIVDDRDGALNAVLLPRRRPAQP